MTARNTRTGRQPKTPAQRAQETADTALRRVHRLQKKRADLTTQMKALNDDLDEAEIRLEYAYADPALPAQKPKPADTPATTKETR